MVPEPGVQRPEYVCVVDTSTAGVLEKPLTVWARLAHNTAVRKGLFLLLLAGVWQGYALWLNNDLLFPTCRATFEAFYAAIRSGVLVTRSWFSLTVLLQGYAAGLLLAGVLAACAMTSRLGNDVLETLTAMCNPLPAIALLPLALLWFGLGKGSIIFVLIHSVVWPVALNTHAGFLAVSPTLRMVGRNYGLTGPRYVLLMLIPAAFPSILTGMKIGWAFAWRTLIAAELVFGVSSGSGGLGWFIYENKAQLDIANVFAGLSAVILIGLCVDHGVFRVIERRTIRKWGMHSEAS